MQDEIRLENLQFSCSIGCYPQEKTIKQRVSISVTMHYNAASAAKTDNLSDAIDTTEVFSLIKKLVETNELELMEAVCEHLAQELLANFSTSKVVVSLTKLECVYAAEHNFMPTVRIVRERTP